MLLLFPYGLLSAGSVHDEVTDTGAVKRVGVVDLGSLEWSLHDWSETGGEYGWQASFSGYKQQGSNSFVSQITSEKYIATAVNYLLTYDNLQCNIAFLEQINQSGVYCANGSRTTAPSGIIYYELETPITVTFTSPKDLGYNVQSGGTEELLPTNPSGSGPMTAPVLLSVKYPLDAVGTLTNLPRNYISVSSMDSFTTALGNFLNANITRTWDTANEKYTFTVVSKT